MPLAPYSKLRIWREAHDLTLEIYRLTKVFPTEERYGLSAQLRRSASSVAANIAEATGRSSRGEIRHFLSIARGSTNESRYHCLLAGDLGYIDEIVTKELVHRYNGLSTAIYRLREKV